MAEKSLVIVESPTKARTITKFLGKDFVVKASNGHIRDLPNSAAEIPAKIKKEPWSRLGVNVQSDFEALYIIPPEKREHVKSLQAAMKEATVLYLATDEDREGESISWHLVETLKPKIPTKRLVFHEITKDAIQHAVESPRDIDENLVKAQETRRIVDRLFGYEVSPLLWKKMARGLSAGRVQSVAIRLLVERERARMRFVPSVYWGIEGKFAKQSGDTAVIDAELTHLGDKRVAIGKDFDPETGKLISPNEVTVLNAEAAQKLAEKLRTSPVSVQNIEEKPFTQRPAPPFVTSSLQQEGNRKLKLSAKRTMTIAQQLYENGFITYMRTDSTTLSQEALNGARSFIEKEYGKQYLPASPRTYQTKVRNAQEAHEAIRPAGEKFASPETVRAQLGDDAFRLYDLIWKRTVASQMNDAQGTYVTVTIRCADALFRASGKTITFPGFLRAYVEGSDDPDADLADQERILPKVAKGEALDVKGMDASEHSTQPPQRFTEGSLIKELERLGIGRPSTWATIVELVLNRSYAFKKGNALVPTFTACAVVALLEKHFAALLDYEFTARLEDDLDAISRGEAVSLAYLKRFYFGNGHAGLKELVTLGEEKIDPRLVCGIPLGTMADDRLVEVRIGRYGAFLSDGTRRTSLPEELPPDELTLAKAQEMLNQADKQAEGLGLHPETGERVYLKNGRFGPYIQLGEAADDKKPKMVSLLKNTKLDDVNLEYALKLLALPKNLGAHSELKQDVFVFNGRFGPYIKCGDDTRSIPLDRISPLEMTLPDAEALLKEPKTRGKSRKPEPLKELGKHPQSGAAINLFNGRYGPYVTDGATNASLPRGTSLETLTLDDALRLIKERAEKVAENPPPAKKGKRGGGAKRSKKSAGADEAAAE